MHPLELNDAQCKSLGSRSRSVLISSAGPKYILRSWPEGYKMFVHYKGPRWPSEVPAQVPTPDRAGNPNSTLIASTSRVSALSTSPHSSHQTIQHIRQFNTSDNSTHPTIQHIRQFNTSDNSTHPRIQHIREFNTSDNSSHPPTPPPTSSNANPVKPQASSVSTYAPCCLIFISCVSLTELRFCV